MKPSVGKLVDARHLLAEACRLGREGTLEERAGFKTALEESFASTGLLAVNEAIEKGVISAEEWAQWSREGWSYEDIQPVLSLVLSDEHAETDNEGFILTAHGSMADRSRAFLKERFNVGVMTMDEFVKAYKDPTKRL
jgi:hypothetical protein